MNKALPYIFISSWLLCACSIDNFFDDWRATIIVIVTMFVTLAVATVMGGER